MAPRGGLAGAAEAVVASPGPSALSGEVPRPGEAEESVAADADRDREQEHRAERLVEHLVQRLVETAGLLGTVVDRGVDEQYPDHADGDALGDVPDLAEQAVGVARLAATALGVEVLEELLAPAAVAEVNAIADDRQPEQAHQPATEGLVHEFCGPVRRAAAGLRAGGHADGGDAEGPVDDRLEDVDAWLQGLLRAVLQAVVDEGLDQLPEHKQEHADRDDPDTHLAERLLGQLPQCPVARRRAAVVAQGQLDTRPRDGQMDDAVGAHAALDGTVHPLAVV